MLDGLVASIDLTVEKPQIVMGLGKDRLNLDGTLQRLDRSRALGGTDFHRRQRLFEGLQRFERDAGGLGDLLLLRLLRSFHRHIIGGLRRTGATRAQCYRECTSQYPHQGASSQVSECVLHMLSSHNAWACVFIDGRPNSGSRGFAILRRRGALFARSCSRGSRRNGLSVLIESRCRLRLRTTLKARCAAFPNHRPVRDRCGGEELGAVMLDRHTILTGDREGFTLQRADLLGGETAPLIVGPELKRKLKRAVERRKRAFLQREGQVFNGDLVIELLIRRKALGQRQVEETFGEVLIRLTDAISGSCHPTRALHLNDFREDLFGVELVLTLLGSKLGQTRDREGELNRDELAEDRFTLMETRLGGELPARDLLFFIELFPRAHRIGEVAVSDRLPVGGLHALCDKAELQVDLNALRSLDLALL